MNPMLLVLVLVLATLAAAALALAYTQRHRTAALQGRYGPEYFRAIEAHHGDRRRAEAALRAREARVHRFRLTSLPEAERAPFADRWRALQIQFVDGPEQAIEKADVLVVEVMRARGYPVADFEQRAADISVDHPRIVESYRAARDIARRKLEGRATTEDLRQAIVHYRTLFTELLETRDDARAEVRS